MSVILVDLENENHDVMISNAGWRDTVDVLRPLGILDSERLARLYLGQLGERITQEEAQAIGNALITGPLAGVDWVRNVFPPDTFWRDALSPKEPYDQATYWPSWLRAFAGFCLTCKGFQVY